MDDTNVSTLTPAPGTQVTIVPAGQPMPWTLSAPPESDSSYVITASAGAPGIEAGEQFTDFAKLSKLLAAKVEALSRGISDPSPMMLAAARPEDFANAYSTINRISVATLGITNENDIILDHQHDWQKIAMACDERRLPGGSLISAGTPGWCAPCQPSYSFCPPAIIDGLVDLPTVIAPRGCLTYPGMPDFGLLYSKTGFCFPAADFDLPEPPPPIPTGPKNKPCVPIECPDTVTCTLNPCGLCLSSSILHDRAFPELIDYFLAQTLVAFAHRMNCRDLSDMISLSTKVPSFGVPPFLGTQTGPGATASILEVVEYYATFLRYKFRLGVNATVEALFPDWVKGVIRADLAKRMGVDLLTVTDANIDSYLAIRKVRAQFVLGLDEAFCDTGTTAPPVQIDPKTSLKFGGDALALGTAPGSAPKMWPDTVSFLMYPAGTFFRARLNMVNIEGGLIDSALLKRNERIVAFFEEARAVCKRCYESLYITVQICASGQTGGGSGTLPHCIQPPPAVTIAEVTTDPDRMSVGVKVDAHSLGPVTIDWGDGSATTNNPGDGTTESTHKYTEDGAKIMTVTDSAAPPNVTRAQVRVPFQGGLEMTLTAVESNPPGDPRTKVTATWDNQGQGPVKIWWGDENPPGPGVDGAEAGTLDHTYTAAAATTFTVKVQDATTATRVKTVDVTVPFA